MCDSCDYNSPNNQIYKEPMTNEWYMDIETFAWDYDDEDYIHQREYINYCPWCGRKLGAKNEVD